VKKIENFFTFESCAPARSLTLAVECSAGATGPQMAAKKVSWAQGTAHSLENFFLCPHQPFQLKKGLSLAFLTSKCAENMFF